VCRASGAFIENNIEEYFISSEILVNETAVRMPADALKIVVPEFLL
jgi:hypothetical protein